MCRSGETVLEGFSIKEQKSLGKKGTRISSWPTLPPKIEKYRKEVISLLEPTFFTSFTEVNVSGGRVLSMDSSPIYAQLYDYEMYGFRKRWWDQFCSPPKTKVSTHQTSIINSNTDNNTVGIYKQGL